MRSNRLAKVKQPRVRPRPKCLSCGRALPPPKRRYCTDYCRETLEAKLELSVGLLNALNVRFATFTFTDSSLCLHVLPERSEVFSFRRERSPYRKPAQDLWNLVESLGASWHLVVKQTGKRYLATRQVLERALRQEASRAEVIPVEEREFLFSRDSLSRLRLTPADLLSPQAKHAVKSAYRREAKRHHPDRGGNPRLFREIHAAHLDLLSWIDHPRYLTRRGVPNKWSYDRYRRARKWLPPPIPKKGWR
ncbi:MAG: J domain-containing protein [bacterium]